MRAEHPGLFLIGHGTRSAQGVAEFRAFGAAVQALRPHVAVGAGLIEHAEPDLDTGIDTFVAAGARDIVAVPLVLLSAGHLKDDGPAALARARARHGAITTVYGRALGIHPSVLAVAEDRARAAGADTAEAVVLISRGSTDPDANGDLAKLARLLADHRGLGTGGDPAAPLGLVEPAFVSLAPPDLASALDRCYRLGARSITVVPHFLFAGVLPDRIVTQSAAWATEHSATSVTVAPLLGADSRLLELVWDRYDEARRGDARMNCDCCVYRAPLPGYEAKVGAAPLSS